MMNKSKIDWCDFSWNPVTGCHNTCEYCYARKQAQRFSGDIRLNKSSGQIKQHIDDDMTDKICYTLPQPFKNESGAIVPFPAGFEPTLHEYRLQMPAQKKKPANIFVGSMTDLFGDWVPDEWIEKVFSACEAAPWHNYLFLTKNVERYCQYGVPIEQKNMWYGTSITREQDMRRFDYLPAFCQTFVSMEPILEDLKPEENRKIFEQISWFILGAETGNRKGKVKPERKWIEDIVDRCRAEGKPVFMKNSLQEIWGEELIQEFPPELKHEETHIPHCKECEYCTRKLQGDRGERCTCEIGWDAEGYDDRGGRHILGRYTRTSPSWCPKRRKEKR